jgi:hypothetical protein
VPLSEPMTVPSINKSIIEIEAGGGFASAVHVPTVSLGGLAALWT